LLDKNKAACDIGAELFPWMVVSNSDCFTGIPELQFSTTQRYKKRIDFERSLD